MLKQMPVSSTILAELMLDALEECVIKGMSTDNVLEIVQQKIEKLPMFQKLQVMVAMSMTDTGGLDIDDEDDDDSPSFFRRKPKKRKKK